MKKIICMFSLFAAFVVLPVFGEMCSESVSTRLIAGEGDNFMGKNFTGDHCRYFNLIVNGELEGLTDDCSDSMFDELDNGEWLVNHELGVIKGIAKCSAKQGNNYDFTWDGNSDDWSATDDDLVSASGEESNCWCQMTSYTDFSEEMCTVESSLWFYADDLGSMLFTDDDCENSCPFRCADLAARREFLKILLQ